MPEEFGISLENSMTTRIDSINKKNSHKLPELRPVILA